MRLPPLSTRFALREGDDAFAAGRPLLGISGVGVRLVATFALDF